MSTAIKRRRGTTAQHAAFTGQVAEITVDIDKKVAVVHDGNTPGGFPLDYDVNVRRFGAKPDGATDCLAAFQAAHDALPATGGTIYVPDGYFMITGTNRYVVISKPNVRIIGGRDAWVITQNSSDPEVVGGGTFNSGFKIQGDNCEWALNLRGGLIGYEPNTTAHAFTIRDCIFRNRHNVGVTTLGNQPFRLLNVHNVFFDTALATDNGNYAAISRNSNSTDPQGQLVIVRNCRFRAAGGINMHNVNTLVVEGCTFQGNDYSCIKMATNDNLRADMNLICVGNLFDGNAVTPASVNRHLSCATASTGAAVQGAVYAMFIQVFVHVAFTNNRFNYFPNQGIYFLDGTFNEASLVFTGNTFKDCTNAIDGPQGNISITQNRFEGCRPGVAWRANYQTRTAVIEQNFFHESTCIVGKTSTDYGWAHVRRNTFIYTFDNLAPLRFSAIGGSDNGFARALFEKNIINVSGAGNTLAIDAGSSGTKAFLYDNEIEAGNTISGGRFTNAFEQVLTGTASLNVPPTKDGSTTLVNTNATGDITYVLQTNDARIEVGTRINVVLTSGTYFMTVTIAGGTIDGLNNATPATRYRGGTLLKIAPLTWVIMNKTGTWNMS